MTHPQEYSMCTLEKSFAAAICLLGSFVVEFEFNVSFLIFCLYGTLVKKVVLKSLLLLYHIFTFRYVNNFLNFRTTYLRVLKFDGCERGQ